MPPERTNASAVTHAASTPVLICFSHLRWNFVYQRPQHLLTRASACARVFYFEEPIFSDVVAPALRTERQASGVEILTPVLSHGQSPASIIQAQRSLLLGFLEDHGITDFIAWYYTPMALLFTDNLHPTVTVYDCMDQLSAFAGASAELAEQERKLFARANVVFTGGKSLYEEKRIAHSNVHLFPSSVDFAHFAAARTPQVEPLDQRAIPHPRIGFFGVIDERLDQALLREVAARESSMHFIMLGPVVKIREEDLPHGANLHYLGQKQYRELPDYLSSWDVAILPFAINASTRFISPTKTPEYLSAGKPVVSTPVRDVAEPYGSLGLAHIAGDAESFAAALRKALEPPDPEWLIAVDKYLGQTSWDATFKGMWLHVTAASEHTSFSF